MAESETRGVNIEAVRGPSLAWASVPYEEAAARQSSQRYGSTSMNEKNKATVTA